MHLRIDHVVLWVADPLRSLEFYASVLGLEGVRVEEYQAKRAPFPSVRISADSILDLMPAAMAPMLNAVGRQKGLDSDSAGHLIHHLCLAMSEAEFEALLARLEARGLETYRMTNSFGARGMAPKAFYFNDPDGNVIEARFYDS